VLDVGCATGRHSFELARDFDEVVGFDFSSAFVQACNKMKTNGRSDYKALVEVTTCCLSLHTQLNASRVAVAQHHTLPSRMLLII
jgi:ubiquinone/menaquinone biosynthesis C-methylase UbiE